MSKKKDKDSEAPVRCLRREFSWAVAAEASAIRVNTDEMDDAVKTIAEVSKKYAWELRVWDLTVGTKWPNGDKPTGEKAVPGAGPAGLSGGPPIGAQELLKFLSEPARPDPAEKGSVRPVILVMKNFHRVFEGMAHSVSSTIQHLIGDKVGDQEEYKKYKESIYDAYGIGPDMDTGKFIVGLMPAETRLPPEVDPLFRVIDHELPDVEEMDTILDGIRISTSDDDEQDLMTDEGRRQICRFALGLTRLQAEAVFSTSVVKFGHIDPKFVWEEKSRILNKEGLVELHQGKETFKDVAGLEGAKTLIRKLLTPNKFNDGNPDCRAKGVLLVGGPGVGKSLIAKAAGNEVGLPVLMVQPGNWMGSLVGESEQKTRKAFQIIKAHAPCVCVVDEVEKVMPKSRGHQGDSGVGARIEASFLTHMNDMPESVFFAFTANDVESMHEAFFRAERVDAVFYVGLPGPLQRATVWRLYLQHFFPAEVNGEAFPLKLNIKLDELLNEYKQEQVKKQKKPAAAQWGPRFAAALLCLYGDERKVGLERIMKIDPMLSEAIKSAMVDDAGWTPAEIKSCCRLSRILEEGLAVTRRKIRPVSVSAQKVFVRLEQWAEEAALDAETGELYQPAQDSTIADAVEEARAGKKRVRRTVRRLKE